MPDDEEWWKPLGTEVGDAERWHTELARQVSTLYDVLDSRFVGQAPSFEDVRSRVDPGEVPDDVVRAVLTEMHRRAPRSPADFREEPFVPLAVGAGRRDRDLDRQERRVLEIAQLATRLDQIRARAMLNAQSLAAVQRPRGVWFGLYALAAFAILGVGLPLALMTLRPVPSGPFVRKIVLLAFGIGLALVVASIANLALLLNREPKSEPSAGSG